MPEPALSKNIFRAYDIRGIYPDTLSEPVAELIGKGIGTHLIRKLNKPDPVIVVGQDSRKSSPALTENLIGGLESAGCTVINTGMNLTPIIHFATCIEGIDGGIEVTASHNPQEYNGFRLDYADAYPFTAGDIQEVYEIIKNSDFEQGTGFVTVDDYFEDYSSYLRKQFSFSKKLKIALDCGSGTSSKFLEDLFKDLGGNFELVFCRLDNSFPQGVPDPENEDFMEYLSKYVTENKVDVGVAFDEDGDRFGVVDEKGTILNNDMLLLLFSQQLLKENKGATVLYDVKSSSLINDFVSKWGGIPKMIKTGHTHFVTEMKAGALLGGEFSGHTYFADNYYGFDDGIYAACRLISLLEQTGESLSALTAQFPVRVHTPEVKIHCNDEKKFDVVKELQEKTTANKSEFEHVFKVDGVRVQVTPSSWFLIRASNTTPNLSIRAEASDKEELTLLLQGVQDLLKSYDLDLQPLKELL